MASVSGSGRAPRKIYHDEPERKAPPIATTGAIAWMRENLFRSPFDTILTMISGALILWLSVGLVVWAVTTANWFVVTRNMQLFMVGLMGGDGNAITRVQIITLLIAFLSGVSIAAWWRKISPVMIGLVVFLIALMLLAPPLIASTATRPDAYFLAGNVEIVEGTQVETPIPRVAFLAREGQTITVDLATRATASTESLTEFGAFTDRAMNALVNNARSTLSAQETAANLQDILADENLNETFRAELEAELAALEAPRNFVPLEAYAVNTVPVTVQILSADLEEVLASETFEPGADTEGIAVEIPADGWYVLEKTVAGDGVATMLQTSGIYPVVSRSITRDGRTVDQYLTVVGNYLSEDPIPEIEGTEVPITTLVDNQYRGMRSLNDYLYLHFGPFLEILGRGLVPVLLVIAAGVEAGRIIDRVSPPQERKQRTSQRLVQWAWMIAPLVVFGLLVGTDVTRWGGLFLTFMLTVVGIVASFPIGILLALGRRATDYPIISTASVIYIEFVRGVPLITVLFLAALALPLVSPSLQTVPGVVRAMVAITLFSAAYLAENVRGGLQSLPPGQTEAAKALGLNAVQTTLFITLPQALRAVIPALVGQFIALFKDTSLVAIVGLLDLLLVANSVVSQPEYNGLRTETYLFISIIYFIFSYAMSYVSRRIEKSGSGVTRLSQAA